MSDVDERVAWLTGWLDELERTARGAIDQGGRGRWGEGQWLLCDPERLPGLIGDGCGEVVTFEHKIGGPNRWRAAHIAANDPWSVLARVEADRLILAEILSWPHLYHDDDAYYSCAQAASTWQDDRSPGSGCDNEDRSGGPCDCGVDHRRGVILGALLSAYRHAPGFNEGWLPRDRRALRMTGPRPMAHRTREHP